MFSRQATRKVLHGMLVMSMAVLLAPATLSAKTWTDERAVGPVVFHADFKLDDYGYLVREIAQLQKDLAEQLNIPAPREPIHIYLFSNRTVYTNYFKHYFPTITPRRAMFIKGRGPGMVFAYRSAELATDVRHESTHALLHSVLPMVPLWLDEGLAEYYESPPGQRENGSPHLTKTRWAARFGSSPPVKRLEMVRTLDDMDASDYRQAWAVVHYMLHGSPVAKEELVGFLSDIRARQAPGLLSDRLKRRNPNFESELTDHFRAFGK